MIKTGGLDGGENGVQMAFVQEHVGKNAGLRASNGHFVLVTNPVRPSIWNAEKWPEVTNHAIAGHSAE